MKLPRTIALSALLLFVLGCLCSAQDRIRRIEATAVGEGNQAGMSIGLTVTLNDYSTAQDRSALWDGFKSGGQPGLAKALVALPARGRLSFSGVADYEVAYAAVVSTDKGRKLRMVARRPLPFGETPRYENVDYLLAALELDLAADGHATGGGFLPACELSIKDKELEILTYQSGWDLRGITIATH